MRFKYLGEGEGDDSPALINGVKIAPGDEFDAPNDAVAAKLAANRFFEAVDAPKTPAVKAKTKAPA